MKQITITINKQDFVKFSEIKYPALYTQAVKINDHLTREIHSLFGVDLDYRLTDERTRGYKFLQDNILKTLCQKI